MLQRIHIIGGPGSGKSYGARHLSRHLGIPSYDRDNLFWDRRAQSYGVPASEVERDAELLAITQEPAWIIEGVYYRWLRPSFERADAIFVLRPNVFLQDWRVVKRFVTRKLGATPTKRERLVDLDRLLQWNHKYDADNLKRAIGFIHDLDRKVVACISADDLIDRAVNARDRSTSERTKRRWRN